mmetsp:Transcript_3292/g.10314  ORF Transcript_3292/g.10314 Transcript_3292/m.10314 type:complete len:293 (+) Transcript_3292:286-1164(+)
MRGVHVPPLGVTSAASPSATARTCRAAASPMASTMPRKMPPSLRSSLEGASSSQSLPSSSTMTRSASATVCRRCAMVSTVLSLKHSRSMRWIMASVSRSTLAVASSATSTRGLRSSARAMQISCRSPTLRLAPPSSTAWLSWPVISRTLSASCTLSSASQHCSSVCSSNGSRLRRSVVLNSTGSCGTMAMRERRSCRPMAEMSSPSMNTERAPGSTRRQMATMRLLLPAPVRPTTPIFSPARTSKVSPLSTSGPSRYRSCRSRTFISPRDGHSGGGAWSGTCSGASGSSSSA